MKKFKITETAEVVRIYEVEAETECEALEKMYEGEIEPLECNDVHTETECEEI